MKGKAAMMDALDRMAGDRKPKEYGEIPPHEVKCPNCGYEWTMGEEEYEEDEEEMEDESED